MKASLLNRLSIGLRSRATLALVAFLVLAGYSGYQATANTSGQVGHSKSGCGEGGGCHSISSSAATTVKIATLATSIVAGHTYTFTLTVENSSLAAAGCDISAGSGKLGTVTGGGLKLLGTDLTHTGPKGMSSGKATFSFSYKAPATPGTDNIFAAGNAVNGNGSADGSDLWNTVTYPVTIVASGPAPVLSTDATVAFGTTATNVAVKKTLTLKNTGAVALNIDHYTLVQKTGTTFSLADTANHVIAPGASQDITVQFLPIDGKFLTATLTIFSDDPANPSTVVAISGAGGGSGVTSDLTPMSSMLLMPNPATFSSSIRITSAASRHAKLQIVDAAGRNMFTQDLGTIPTGISTVELPLRSLANGNYVAICRFDNGQMMTSKLVIRK